MIQGAKAATVLEEQQSTAKPKSAVLKRWRWVTQTAGAAILGQWSFYGIFRCPFIVPYVSCQNCPVITCHGRLFTIFWGFWLLLPLSAVLFGRAFCAWACPGGTVHRLMSWIGGLKPFKRSFIASNISGLKYLGLALALFVWLEWGQPRSAVPIRVGDFFASVGLTFEHANLLWLARTGMVLVFLALGLLSANFWCRCACPTGGLLNATRSFSLFRVSKTAQCNDCGKCLRVCGMQTRPLETDCTNCGDCLDACPQNAIRIGRGRR